MVLHRLVFVVAVLFSQRCVAVEAEYRLVSEEELQQVVKALWSDGPHTVDVTWLRESEWEQRSEESLRETVTSLYRQLRGKGLDIKQGDESAFEAAVDEEVDRKLREQAHKKVFRQRIRANIAPGSYRVDQIQLAPEKTSFDAFAPFELSFVRAKDTANGITEYYQLNHLAKIASRDHRKSAAFTLEPVWQIGRYSPEMKFALRTLLAGDVAKVKEPLDPARIRLWSTGNISKLRLHVRDVDDVELGSRLIQYRLSTHNTSSDTVLYRWRSVIGHPERVVQFESLPLLPESPGAGSVSILRAEALGEPLEMIVVSSSTGAVRYRIEDVKYDVTLGSDIFEFAPQDGWATVDYRPEKPLVVVDGHIQEGREAIDVGAQLRAKRDWPDPLAWVRVFAVLCFITAVFLWIRLAWIQWIRGRQ